MKKIVVVIFPLLLITSFLSAQTVYQFSFTYLSRQTPVDYNALFIDNNDGTGKVRLKFTAAADTILAHFDVKEEIAEANAVCPDSRIYYKLQNPKFIESKRPDVSLPAYICFVKETVSGLYEPAGVTDNSGDCNASLVKFSQISTITQQELTKEFVLAYFKVYEDFYRSLFVTNNSKALTTAERNTKLYLLFVSNVTDPKIGIADRKGMNETISFFRKVTEFLGISAFIYDTVTGTNFNKQTVLNKIETFLTPAPNDIVVFYYAGHGFRMPKENFWQGPYIDLRDIVTDRFKRYQDNSVSTEKIWDMVRSKGARLNLIIAECCNDTITKTNPIVKEPPLAGKKGGFGMNWSTQNCRDLFLNATPTTILAAAASPRQLAISNDEFGGYFSTFFRNSLEVHLGYAKTKVTWDDVFKQTKQQTETKAGRTWCNDEKTVKCNPQRPFTDIRYGRF